MRVGSIDVQATKASVRLFYQGYVNEDSVILVYPQLLAQVRRSSSRPISIALTRSWYHACAG